MIYALVRPIARYVLSWYYRRIEISGLEHIPADGPVIFAANHPTAFIEPCILACYQPRSLHFLARGNLFKNRLATWILNRLHILPVYRIEDGGYGKLKDNFSTFSACRRALSAGKAIMILAEGRCIHEKRLRPLRKGTGRVALSALAEDETLGDIPVVPIGVNFTHPERLRSSVLIRCGKPMSTAAFLARYRDNENRGVLEFTRELRNRLSPLVIQLPDLETDTIGEGWLQLDRNDHRTTLKYGFATSGEQLERELAIAAAVHPDTGEHTVRYFSRLHQLGLTDEAVSGAWKHYLRLDLLAWLKSLLGVFLLLWQIPLLLIGEYIGGTSTRAIEFYSPVRFAAVAVGMIVIPPLFLLGFDPGLLIYIVAGVGLAPWSWQQLETARRWYHARMAWRQIPAERQRLQQLRQSAVDEMHTALAGNRTETIASKL